MTRPFDACLSPWEDEVSGARDRADIDDRYKWNLTSIFNGWEAWQQALDSVEADLPGLADLRDTLDRSGAALLRGIETILGLRRRIEVVSLYSHLRSDEDTRDGDNLARQGRASALGVAFAEGVSWFKPELISIDEERLRTLLVDEPGLGLYTQFLDQIRRVKEHTLDTEREGLLAAAISVTRGANSVFNALNNADLKFGEVEDEQGRRAEMTKASYMRLLRLPDRRVRRTAFEVCLDAYGGVVNTMAANLDANVKNHVFFARARGYESTLDAVLYPNAIPTSVYHELLATTRANLDVVHRWVDLKRRVLGLDDLQEYDLYAPLFPDAEFSFEYDDARSLLLEALAPLGEDYGAILREGFESGWIDVHESRGKRSGAYSNGVYDTSPYVLLNWGGQLQDTFTLAHEMGHAAHTWLACRHQDYVYGDYTIFTAEVASTCNELLLMRHLLDGTDDPRRRLFLLDRFIAQVNSTVVRQVMFAEFELEIHRRGERDETLTASSLGDTYELLLRDYWGDAVGLDAERSRRSWARIPHFYYNYYVYQYATAFSAAVAASMAILEGDVNDRERYLDVLRTGSSRYPVETLQRAGIDMTSARPVEKVYGLFGELLGDIETLLDREDER